MEIRWIEDQPSIKKVKEQIEESGLISDLVKLVKEQNLSAAQARKWIKDHTGRHLYTCEVSAPPTSDYYLVHIKRSDVPTTDAIGEIYKSS